MPYHESRRRLDLSLASLEQRRDPRTAVIGLLWPTMSTPLPPVPLAMPP